MAGTVRDGDFTPVTHALRVGYRSVTCELRLSVQADILAVMPAIQVEDLWKSYGSVGAVAGVDLSVEEGEVFALLGPNGAGKTTTVEILEGHRQRTAGEVAVLGFDPETGGRRYRERIGIVLQEASLERELRVREVLGLYTSLYPDPLAADQVIGIIGLEEKADARIKTLSGGQRRRLELGLGIIGNPDLIFLDEPTTGFDPSARRGAWSLIANLRSLGKTILLTTHYMDEAQHLADRVAVMARGTIVARGTPDTLGGRDDQAVEVSFRLPEGYTVADLPGSIEAGADIEGRDVRLHTEHPTDALHQLTGWALEKGIELDSLSVVRPTLEDVYLRLTGDEASEDEIAGEVSDG